MSDFEKELEKRDEKWRSVGYWEGVTSLGNVHDRIRDQHREDLGEAEEFSKRFNEKYRETLKELARR